jgi:hypothetical protein
MERRKSSYSIHRRPAAKHRHIYYVRFRGEDGRIIASFVGKGGRAAEQEL